MSEERIVIAKPDPSALVAEFTPLVERAKAMAVVSQGAHAEALGAIKTLRGVEKKIEEHYEPTRKALDLAKKELLLARDSMIAPFSQARVAISAKCDGYEAEQRRIAEVEQRRLQEIARKEEEDRKLAEACEAEARGDDAQAAAILDEPVSAPVVHIAPAVAKVAGVSTQTRYSAEVYDLLALARYVAQHPEWISLLEPNAPNLNRLAVAQRESLSIPGVRAVASTIRAVR